MSPQVSSAKLHGIWRNQQKPTKSIKNLKGECCKNHLFQVSVGDFRSVLAVVLVLGSFVCGFCEVFTMVSVPLGFEISGHETRTWVSENGVFAFGFLGDDQKDEGLVVGIWYNNMKKGGGQLPVWTVGGGVRVSENSTFKLSMDGDMFVYDNPNDKLIWSSNTGSLGVKRASLLDNGNLVLLGIGQKVVWESFHSPTDTLLPGQSLHFPQSLQPSSTNSIASFYSLVFRSSGNVELVWKDNVTYWSSHLSSSVVVKEARFEANGVFGLFDAHGSVTWSKSSKDFREPSVALRHLRIDVDGNLRIYSWDDVLLMWKVGWQAVENQCDVFGSCGLYSVCGYNATGPICDCLSQDSLNVGAVPGVDLVPYGCKKMVDLSNCKMGLSMLVLKQTVLYGLYPPHDIDTMLSTEACEEYCLNDSSCFAATAKNDGSGLCTIKRTSFISGYQYSSVSAISFLKVCLIPQAASTHGANLHNVTSIPLSAERPMALERNINDFIVTVVVLFCVTALLFVSVEIIVFWFIFRRRRMNAQRRIPFRKDTWMNPHYSALIRLSFEEVKELTKNLTDQLGPTAFKGILPNLMPVVAKLLNNVVASERDFQMAVSILGSTHHRNLVSLKGFCFEPKQKFLLYEYMNNGSLDQWLFNSRGNQNKGSWKQRIDIAIGVARAIAYLHSECQQCIAHGNLRLKNVLLDENLVAKVTGFGLQCLLEKQTASSSETLPERDVYMYGEMLLQIVTGKREAVEGKVYSLAYKMYREGNLGEIIDSQLENIVEREGVERAVRVAFWCLQDQPCRRPSICEVVKVLEGALPVDSPPMSAAFTRQETPIAEEGIEGIEIAS